jgi:isoquinoline 1-oxidoreductase subunit beta
VVTVYTVSKSYEPTRPSASGLRVSTTRDDGSIVVIELLGEGGGYTILGREVTDDAWQFKVDGYDVTPALIDEEPLLSEKSAAWLNRVSRDHAVGVACNEYHGTAVACAVDVSIESKRPRIHRATVALHCGTAVSPLSVEAQFQGGFVFGLTQLMARGAITLKNGHGEQRNFDGFAPPYMADAPVATDVHIVPSDAPPTACGECPVPVISPAVVNALARLTGKRHRTLPLVTV